MARFAFLVLLPLALAACANNGLRDIRPPGEGPDEFLLQPSKPLEAPGSYADLPVPTPGQANLTDRSAINEGITAFGGRPEAEGGGIPASDGALVQHASRLGVAPGIRADMPTIAYPERPLSSAFRLSVLLPSLSINAAFFSVIPRNA